MASATSKASAVDFKSLLVPSTSVPKSKRGRKAIVNASLKGALEILQKNPTTDGVPSALPLETVIGIAADKAEQNAKGQTIRSHFRMVFGDDAKCSISWDAGKPFVSVRK